MLILFSQGKIIFNNRGIMVKLEGNAKITLQAQVDELEFIGGANVITAIGSGISWDVRLDDNKQLQFLSSETGVGVKHR